MICLPSLYYNSLTAISSNTWKLHCDTVQRAVLADERQAVDSLYRAVGEYALQLCHGDSVFRRTVRWHHDSPVDDKKIGVGGGQSLSVGVDDRICHRQWHESVWFAVGSAERPQLIFHSSQFVVMLVGSVGALHVGDSRRGAETSQSIDMAIGIVALQCSVFEPQCTASTEIFTEKLLYFLPRHTVAIVGQQAAGGGKDSTASVCLDAAALENYTATIAVAVAVDDIRSCIEKAAGNEIVEIGSELKPPTVEAEIEHYVASTAIDDGDTAEVASPSVVGGYLYDYEPNSVADYERTYSLTLGMSLPAVDEWL